ncbi:Bordetella pertussis toxin A [Moelleriella libera RCEF 2490]|uniref:Bordetella pertussis toxin A n=1 Tax=Moelleriella libera RCEF 2490 TaxID=1081109 RepID=A0A162I6W1_9HYPO|nr:Bordetella pertussis toxin A [Moelleriella libera RCEF 2490]
MASSSSNAVLDDDAIYKDALLTPCLPSVCHPLYPGFEPEGNEAMQLKGPLLLWMSLSWAAVTGARVNAPSQSRVGRGSTTETSPVIWSGKGLNRRGRLLSGGIDRRTKRAVEPHVMTAADVAATRAAARSKQGVFYRGDSRPPEEVFEHGFEPMGTDADLSRHLSFSGNSRYVSLTRSRATAAAYAFGRTGGKTTVGYLYRLAPNDIGDGYWIPGMLKGAEVDFNQEFAVIGAVRRESIQGVYILQKEGDRVRKTWRPNPHFAYQKYLCSLSRKKKKRGTPPLLLLARAPATANCISDPLSTEEMQPQSLPTAEQEEFVEKAAAKGSSTADVAAAPAAEELAAIDRSAAEEFSSLMVRYGFSVEIPHDSPMELSKLRSQFKDYRQLNPARGASSKPPPSKMPGRVAVAALTVTSLPLYLTSVYDSFQSDFSALQKAAVVTSIVPVVGCSVKFVADGSVGPVPVASTAICFVGDALLFTPLAPVGLVLHIFSIIVDGWEKSTLSYVQGQRDIKWEQSLSKILGFISSDEWRANLRRRYTTEVAAILFAQSELNARLDSATRKLETSGGGGGGSMEDDMERRKMMSDIEAQKAAALRQTCAQLREKQRFFAEDIPGIIADWIQDEGEASYTQFVREYNNIMVGQWKAGHGAAVAGDSLKPRLKADRLRLRIEYFERVDWFIEKLQADAGPKINREQIMDLVRVSSKGQIPSDRGLCAGLPREPAPIPRPAPPAKPRILPPPLRFPRQCFFDQDCRDAGLQDHKCDGFGRCRVIYRKR